MRNTAVLLSISCFLYVSLLSAQEEQPAKRKVKGFMQPRPGAPRAEVEVDVFEVPVGLPSVPSEQADLDDHDLVMGMVVDGQAMAYPIRYLAMYEIVDDKIGDTPVAPTW